MNWTRWAVAVAIVVSVGLVAGCGSGSDGGNGGGTVPLGTMRTYAGGDEWDYSVSGAFVAGGGTSTPISPATATLKYSSGTTVIGGVACHIAQLTSPLSYPGTNGTFTHTLAVTQAPDGTVTLVGYVSEDGTTPVPLDTPAAGLNPSTFATATSWDVDNNIFTYGAFVIHATKVGTETITVGGRAYECYKVTGTASLGGFPATFTVWMNPQLGSFAKASETYDDNGGVLTIIYELQSTNFTL